MKQLSNLAKKVINNYLFLPFEKTQIPCPYFNNRRQKKRAALRVISGKGRPEEIIEEAKIIAIRERVNLQSLNSAELNKFLVNHDLGIDCSALAYYVLDAEASSRNVGKLSKMIIFPPTMNLLRQIIRRLRPVENTDVKVLADPANSYSIKLSDVQAGDLIIIQKYGQNKNKNHVIIINEIEEKENQPLTLSYVHALAWSKDGLYNHGVRQGKIEIINPLLPLTEQKWLENNVSGQDNETLQIIKNAEIFDLRRLKIFS